MPENESIVKKRTYEFFIKVLIAQIVLMAYGIITYIAYQIEMTFILAYRGLHEANGELSRKNRELIKAREEIRSLKETLPICSSCKRIRDDSGEFIDVDVYLRKHTDTDVTHSLCPDCLRELYPDIAESFDNEKG